MELHDAVGADAREDTSIDSSFTPPRFSHIYLLKTNKEENSKGSWHGWEMSRVSPVAEKATYIRCKEFAESITAGNVVVKHGEDEANPEDSSVF